MRFQKFSDALKRPLVAGILVFAGLFFLTQTVAYQHYLLLEQTRHRELVNAGRVAREKLQSALSYSFSATKTLSFIYTQYGLSEGFDTVAKQILQSNKYIDAIELVEGGIITHVYPVKDNRAALGYNILTDTSKNREAYKAIEKRTLFFAGPFNLKQGGTAVVGRLPIFIGDKFTGFSVVLIKLSTLISALGLDSANNPNYIFQLSKINPETRKEEFFLPQKELFNGSAAAVVEVPEGEWKIYVAPMHSNLLMLVVPYSIIGLLLSCIGGAFAWYIARQPFTLKQLVAEQTMRLTKSEENYRQTIERVSDAFVALDRNWCYTYMNKKAGEIFNRDPQKMIGRNIWTEFPEGLGQPFYHAYHRAVQQQQYIYIEEYYPKFERWFENHIYPSPNGLSVFFRDVTEKKKADAEILREKKLSEAIINSLPGAFYYYNDQGRFLRWNRNFELVSGYGGHEIKEMHPLDFFDKDEKELVRSKIAEVFLNGSAEVEADLFTRDKRKLPYYFNGNKVNYEGADYLIGMGIDITERKRVEIEVLHEKELSESIINSLPGVFYMANIDGQLLRWNKNFEAVSGYSAHEIANMRVRDFVEGDEKQSLLRRKEMAIQSGMTETEVGFTTKDKRKLPYYFTSLFTKYNDEPCLLGIGMDITALKKAEEAIQISEEKYRYLFNNNPALIFIWDLATLSILEANETAEREYGYTRDEFMQMDVLQLRPAEDHDRVKQFAQRMLHGQEQTARGIWRHLKKNGEMMFMDISSHLIDYNGRPAILSLAKDVTVELEVQERLKKSYDDIQRLNAHLETIREEERSTIAREIHDELGQQLTGLKMDVSWLGKKLASVDGALVEKTNSVIKLIDETIKSVRRISSELRPGILDDLGLEAALEWLSSDFEKRTGISCIFTCKMENFEPVRNVATGIFRIYQEALTNIIRHAAATKVAAVLELGDTYISFTINDNGKGFNAEEAKAKNTLGLIGMNERARMLGGELTINSVKGQGTQINLTIPLNLASTI